MDDNLAIAYEWAMREWAIDPVRIRETWTSELFWLMTQTAMERIERQARASGPSPNGSSGRGDMMGGNEFLNFMGVRG